MFIISSGLILWVCFALLLPTFVLKLVIWHRNSMAISARSRNNTWARYESHRSP
jgi:hypothetical protein